MWRSRLLISCHSTLFFYYSKLKGLLKVRVSRGITGQTLVCVELTLFSESILIIDGKSLGLVDENHFVRNRKMFNKKVTKFYFRYQNNNQQKR